MKITKCPICESIDIEHRTEEYVKDILYRNPDKAILGSPIHKNNITEELTIGCRTCGNYLFYSKKVYLEGVCDESETEKEEEIENAEKAFKNTEFGSEAVKRKVGETIEKTKRDRARKKEAIGNETEEKEKPSAS